MPQIIYNQLILGGWGDFGALRDVGPQASWNMKQKGSSHTAGLQHPLS